MSSSASDEGGACEGETVSMTWGPETFTPVRYNSMTVGPFTYATRVREGETLAQAMRRASDAVRAHAEQEFNSRIEAHVKSVREIGQKVRGRIGDE